MPIINHPSRPRPRRPLHSVPDPALPAVVCAPWCREGDGHTDALFHADQHCMSDHPGVHVGGTEIGAYAYRTADGTTDVDIYAETDTAERGFSGSVHCTEAQAHLYAERILAVCNLVRGTGPRDCIDCDVTFEWDESPDDDRCASCADAHEWHHGRRCRMNVDLDDTSRCPLGVRCESCGVEREDLAVVTAELGRLGIACLTLCPPCSASDVAPPVSVSTAARLVGQHCTHLGIDLDQMAAAMETDR